MVLNFVQGEISSIQEILSSLVEDFLGKKQKQKILRAHEGSKIVEYC